MDPVCFHIGAKPIYWYGVFVALGFLAGVMHWSVLGRRAKMPDGFASELAVWIMVGGLVGARVGYVVANWSHYAEDPLAIIRVDQGGLIYYGGFIGGVVAVLVLAAVRRMDRWALGDFVISALPLGHALGRIGCFTKSCCYGAPTDWAWGMTSEGAVRHPVQLVEAAANIAVYLGLLWWQRRRHKSGTTVGLYLLTYPIVRFMTEFLRGDERERWAGLNVAQWISMGLLVTGVAVWNIRQKVGRDVPDEDAEHRA